MRLMIQGICAALLLASASSFAAGVNVEKSKVNWKGTKIVGESHEGTIGIKSADLKFKEGEPVSGEIVIDMTSIKNTDIKSEGMNKKLVGHLNSKDFFNVSKHKTATLKIKKIQKVSDKFYFLSGDLKIKGKSHPVKVKAEASKAKGAMQMVKAAFKFDRTKYGIKYGSGTFFENLGDKMISDEIEISVEIAVEKKAEKVAAK
ncbi:MAG: YceI family protein [Pseudomonadota bacterium]